MCPSIDIFAALYYYYIDYTSILYFFKKKVLLYVCVCVYIERTRVNIHVFFYYFVLHWHFLLLFFFCFVCFLIYLRIFWPEKDREKCLRFLRTLLLVIRSGLISIFTCTDQYHAISRLFSLSGLYVGLPTALFNEKNKPLYFNPSRLVELSRNMNVRYIASYYGRLGSALS